MLNRDLESERELTLEWRDPTPTRVILCETLTGPDVNVAPTGVASADGFGFGDADAGASCERWRTKPTPTPAMMLRATSAAAILRFMIPLCGRRCGSSHPT